MNDYTDRRPYAATANVLAVLERIRSRNLPDKLDNDFLRIAGIGPAVFGRVRDALLFLGLVDEDDAPTDVLRAMAKAPEAEYRQLLETAVRTAYRPDFDVISPAQDTQAQIIDAFRKYEPRSQTNRMVMLLLGLCHAAGMEVLDTPRERKMTTASPRRGAAKTARGSTSSRGKSSGSGGEVEQTSPPPPGMLFGVTEADISALEDEEFDVVWKALGTVARARARARLQPHPTPTADSGDVDDFDDGDDA